MLTYIEKKLIIDKTTIGKKILFEILRHHSFDYVQAVRQTHISGIHMSHTRGIGSSILLIPCFTNWQNKNNSFCFYI